MRVAFIAHYCSFVEKRKVGFLRLFVLVFQLFWRLIHNSKWFFPLIWNSPALFVIMLSLITYQIVYFPPVGAQEGFKKTTFPEEFCEEYNTLYFYSKKTTIFKQNKTNKQTNKQKANKQK